MSKEEVRDKGAQQIAASRMSSSVQSASLSDCWPASTAASSLDEKINLGCPLAMDSSTMDSSSQGGTSLLSVSSPSSSKASLGRETNMLASSACVHHGGQLCVQIATDEPEASHIFAVDFGMFEQQARYRPRELGEFQKVRLKMLSTRCGATPSMKFMLCCENATSSNEISLKLSLIHI